VKRLIIVLFPLVLIVAGSSAVARETPSELEPARMQEHVRVLAQDIGVRLAGTEGERRAAAYIAGQFRHYGLVVEEQRFSAGDRGSSNVVGTRPGHDPNYGTIYIGAHYDTVAGAPGANDNASGTAVMLELARVFATETMSPTLQFIAFGAEEGGLIGSRIFVSRLDFFDVHLSPGMINMDCVGYGTGQVVSAVSFGYEQSRDLLRLIAETANDLGYGMVPGSDGGHSDHAPFATAGVPAAFVYTASLDGICGPHYHKPGDIFETIDVEQMERTGQIVEASIRRLASTVTLRTPAILFLPLMRR
jgi:aminopeptidase YwaD